MEVSKIRLKISCANFQSVNTDLVVCRRSLTAPNAALAQSSQHRNRLQKPPPVPFTLIQPALPPQLPLQSHVFSSSSRFFLPPPNRPL